MYAWVKADLDRYVRKVGVRSIEDTRYQARLDAKVEELAEVFCSKEFMQDLYHTLAKDQEFVNMLQSVWQIELSVPILDLYRMLVLYRQPLVRTDSGYQVPSTEEVIAGIMEFFNRDERTSKVSAMGPSQSYSFDANLRVAIIAILREFDVGAPKSDSVFCSVGKVDSMLCVCFISYVHMYIDTSPDLHRWQIVAPSFLIALIERGFSVPPPAECLTPELSAGVSNVRNDVDMTNLRISVPRGGAVPPMPSIWVVMLRVIKDTASGPPCECPFVYFFVKYCLDHGMGVPKLALAVYDRMNIQLSREFIRCANPSCEHSKLDQSTGKVKFKQCSRCKAVIYCSRECQVAHYPEHKRLCREHLTG